MSTIRFKGLDVTVTYSRSSYYDKKGRLQWENEIRTTYRNADTGRIATADEIKRAGLERAPARMKVTSEVFQSLYRRQNAPPSRWETPGAFLRMLGGRHFRGSTAEQVEAFRENFTNLFRKSNPTAKELADFQGLIRTMSASDLQAFYDENMDLVEGAFHRYRARYLTSVGIRDENAARATRSELMERLIDWKNRSR